MFLLCALRFLLDGGFGRGRAVVVGGSLPFIAGEGGLSMVCDDRRV